MVQSPPPPAPPDSSVVKVSPTTAQTSGDRARLAVHMTLQHKGGVTKSFCANCLAQYYQATGRVASVLDADPTNKTLAAYKALNVRSVDIMKDDNNIDTRKFDDLIEAFVTEDNDFIVDNGATNFLPFISYLVANSAASILADNGRRLVLHIPLVGGEALNETMVGFDDIAKAFATDVQIVVWLNEAAKGVISLNGKNFEESRSYERNKGKILGLIRVPYHTSELFGQDMETILSKKLTFAQAIESPDTRLMSKQRLKQMQREIFEQISAVI